MKITHLLAAAAVAGTTVLAGAATAAPASAATFPACQFDQVWQQGTSSNYVNVGSVSPNTVTYTRWEAYNVDGSSGQGLWLVVHFTDGSSISWQHDNADPYRAKRAGAWTYSQVSSVTFGGKVCEST